ncbi:MAG: hypothetical protein ABIM21_00440 [candidate division WOR-3 bacterium]
MPSYSPPPFTPELEITYYEELFVIDTNILGNPISVEIDNNCNIYARSNNKLIIAKIDSSFTIVDINRATDTNFGVFIGKSSTGKYIVVNGLVDKIIVYKNGNLLQQLNRQPLKYDESFANSTVAISPNGKYIVLFGYHSSTGNIALKVWKGK